MSSSIASSLPIIEVRQRPSPFVRANLLPPQPLACLSLRGDVDLRSVRGPVLNRRMAPNRPKEPRKTPLKSVSLDAWHVDDDVRSCLRGKLYSTSGMFGST